MTVLRAYLHKVEKTGNLHVRVMQPTPLGDEFAADMHKCGSPAHWEYSRMEWDFPLTAACVLALQRTAEKHKVQIYWSDDLRQFADEQKKIDDYEQQIRMSIENIVHTNQPLPGYVTNTMNGEKVPMRHQMIAYHWGLRFSGLMLAHSPGLGKSRSAIDLSRGWYDINVVRPMQQVWVPEANAWGVRGGILFITKAAMIRTIAHEYRQWQGMTPLEISGEKSAKLKKAAIPAHAHIVNYESLKCVLHNQYDGLIIDECFPAGTPVRTLCGVKPIQELQVGDMVLALDHDNHSVVERKVTYVFRRKRQSALLTITTSTGSITCTANHPIWTTRGYIPASQVVVGDVFARFISNPVCSVRKSKSETAGCKGLLSPEGMLLQGVSRHDSRQDHRGIKQDICFSPDEGKQSYEEARDEGEVICHAQGDETRTTYEGRQRENDLCGVDTVRRIESGASGLVYAADYKDGQEVRSAERAQSRFIESVVEGGCGVERGITSSSCPERAGCSQDTVFEGSRVVGIDIHEPSDSRLISGGCADDTNIVFNLEVEEHHNYIASDFLVHNCHSCANSSTQTENVIRLAQHARRRLALTGTPISNNLESAFFQMLIVDGGRALGPSKTKFLEEYFTTDKNRSQGAVKNIPKAGAVESVSNRMARCTYFLKKEDALDLPIKTHTPVYLEMSPDQDRYYNTLKDDYLVYIQDSQVSVQQAAARMMKLRQICQGFVLDDQDEPKDFSSSKVDALVDMLKNKLYGRKVVVWAVFTHEINALCKRLMAEQIGFVRLDGTVTSKKVRDQGLELWNTNRNVSVFIGQIQMGVGITLHANECVVPCYDCVYLGIDYSFINWTQSQDRIHRIGQKYPCSYTYLLTADGVDRNIYQSLQAKANTSNAVYKAGKEFYASLVKGDEPNLAAVDLAAA